LCQSVAEPEKMTPLGTHKRICLFSPAKINLFLHVIGQRLDGYHDLVSLMQMVDFGDEILFDISPEGILLKGEGASLPPTEKNLVFRAASLLKRECGVSQGVRIFLKKVIPISAGLGGGSSNAAATLLGLNLLWNLNLSRGDLIRFGDQLGADVPFFFQGPLALALEKGGKLVPLKGGTPLSVLLVNPGISISTGGVFRSFQAQQNIHQEKTFPKPESLGLLKKWLTIVQEQFKISDFEKPRFSFPDVLASLRNDLESVVFNQYPQVQKIKEDLQALGTLMTLMSGSGSTVFAIFENPEKMKRAKKALKTGPGWMVRETSTLERSPWKKELSKLRI